MITIEQAKQLKYRQIIFHCVNRNKDGTPQRWRINGSIKLWKRSPNKIEIPLKCGLRVYDHLTEKTLDLMCLTSEEALGKIINIPIEQQIYF